MKHLLAIIMFQFSLCIVAQNNFSFHYNKGVENFRKEQYNEAINDFSNALKYKNDSKNQYQVAGALMDRALCRMHLKSFSGALNDIDEAIKLKPEFTELYYTRSLIHIRNKQYDEAIVWAKKGLEIKPENEELLLNIIMANRLRKNYKEVLVISDSLLKINPRSTDALNARADALRHEKNYADAIATYTKVIEMDPQNIEAFYDRGIANAHNKDFDAAYADIKRAMTIDTAQLWAGYNNIAFFIKFEQKDYQGSLEYFDKAIKLNPKFSNAYNNRGFAKLQLNDLKGARADIMRAQELEPTNSYAYRTMALYFIADNKPKQACEQLDKAIKFGYSDDYDDEVDKLIKVHCNK